MSNDKQKQAAPPLDVVHQSAFGCKSEHVGHDDHGNQIFLVTVWNQKDPDDRKTYLDKEQAY